jgi:peptidoglycan/LPS O-acetylase OafA/YrhL
MIWRERSLGTIESLLTRRRNNFDLLRFIAASFVIISHSFALLSFDQPLVGKMTIGSLGVNIFFLMSGFLVTKSWDGHPRMSAFLAKRLLRILPGLIGVTLFTVFVIGPLFTTIPLREYFLSPLAQHYLLNVFIFPLQYILTNVFWGGVANNIVNGSIWTLPLEFLAYLGLLVAVRAGLLKRRLSLVTLMGTIVITASLLVGIIRNPEALLFGLKILWLVKYTAFFMVGSAYYVYRHQIRLTDARALAALIILAVTAYLPGQYVVMLLVLPYLILYLAFLPSHTAASFGRWGDFSYGMYIYAWPIQQSIISFTHQRIGLLPLLLFEFPVIVALAAISWHLIEKPALKLKRRFNRERYPVAWPQLRPH